MYSVQPAPDRPEIQEQQDPDNRIRRDQQWRRGQLILRWQLIERQELFLRRVVLELALLGGLGWRETVGRATWLALLGACAGVAVMIGEGLAEGELFGDLAALGAALSFAGFSVALRHGREVDMVPAVLYAGIISGVISASAAVALGTGLVIPLRDVGLSFTYGGVGIAGGLLLFTLGSRYVPAAELTLLSLTEVILGPIWVWLAFAEEPSRLTLLGGVILLASITALTIHGVRRSKPPPLVT